MALPSRQQALLAVVVVVAFTAILIGVLAWAGVEPNGAAYYHK